MNLALIKKTKILTGKTVILWNGNHAKGSENDIFLQGMFFIMTCRLMLAHKFYSLSSISCPIISHEKLP